MILAIWQRAWLYSLFETKEPKDIIRAQIERILNDETKPKENWFERSMKYCGNKVCFWYYQHKVQKGGGAASQLKLGQLYENGDGVQKDLKQAFNLYKKAAKCDFAPSMVGLARYYEQGIGVQKDKVEALKWYVKAVQNENIYDEQKKEAQLAIERLEPNAKKMQSDASKK